MTRSVSPAPWPNEMLTSCACADAVTTRSVITAAVVRRTQAVIPPAVTFFLVGRANSPSLVRGYRIAAWSAVRSWALRRQHAVAQAAARAAEQGLLVAPELAERVVRPAAE